MTHKMLLHNNFKTSISLVTDVTEIETTWRDIEKGNANSFFLTWSWLGPWVRLVIKKRDLYLFQLKNQDRIVALCFITLCKTKRMRGLITVRQVQINEHLARKLNMVIQYNSILTEAGYENIAWEYFIKTIEDWNKTWDEIAISSLTEEQIKRITNTGTKLKLVIDKTHRTWKIPLNSEYGQPEKLLTYFKSKSRQQLRQSLKACHNEFGEITVSAAENYDQALSYFMQMESLHTAKWIKAGKSGSFANANWVKFHQDVINTGFPRGEIIMLRVHGTSETLGFLYGCIYSGTAYMIQTGFIESRNNRLRPGYVSHFYAMLYCVKNNLNYYDFLPDDELSYKKFFTNPGEPIHWVQYQKRKMKFFIEKTLRLIIACIRNRQED